MTTTRITKKFLKVFAITGGLFIVLIMAFHFWFVHYSESIIEDLVSSQSNGQLKLKVKKFRFNWFNYKMDLRNPVFYSNDTGSTTAYQFRVERLSVQLKAIWPLIFEKKMLIDSMHLYNPDIRVLKMRAPSKDSTDDNGASMSLPKEMGRIYNSIQDALKVLKVDRFQIDNGRFSLINTLDAAEPPVVITRINFHLDNLQVDSTKHGNEKKILFSDNVALHTSDQNIVFPDGRHRLSFANFRINILNKFVEFDSCTVMASKGDSSDNSFRIFFDKLQMTNIDFNALYHQEVIKADSVYCINPKFRLDVTLHDKTNTGKASPKLNELIQQLTGDMQLAFVVVENASFDINTIRNDRTSSFTSEKNNFELQGLNILKRAPKPLTVDKFVMAIRNYENFLRDSSYAMQFDSILINNDRISLSNFTYQELEKNKPVNTLVMPQFELQGLSWDDLIFDQQLKARNVTLYRPVIHYSVGKNKQVNSGDVFGALAGIGNFMQLEKLNIHDGQVNLLFHNKEQLKLENASMSISGNELVNSKKITNIQHSVDRLFFKKGLVKIGDVTADLTDVNYSGVSKEELFASTLKLKHANGIEIDANGVKLGAVSYDDKIRHAKITGLNWSKAAIILSAFPSFASKTGTSLDLRGIKGNNTSITAGEKGKRFRVFLQQLNASEFSTGSLKQTGLTGFNSTGSDLTIENGSDKLVIDKFDITDQQNSQLTDIRFTRNNGTDSINILVPGVNFIADINALIKGKLDTRELKISKPSIHINLGKKNTIVADSAVSGWPDVSVAHLIIDEPSVEFSSNSEKGFSKIKWTGTGNHLDLSGIGISQKPTQKIVADNMQLSLNHFLFTNAKGKTFDAKDGELNLKAHNIEFRKNDIAEWDWKLHIISLDANNFILDSLGKNAGRLALDKARLNNFAIVSTALLNLRELVSSNTKFRLEEMTGSYHNAKNQFNWYNTIYDKSSRTFSADSFNYRPTEDQKDFTRAAPYQTDYITASTGRITLGPFEIEKYLRDTVLDMGTMTVNNAGLSVFRDMRKPRQPGIVRPLPVDLLKKIGVPLQIDSLLVKEMNVTYAEHNEKTDMAGRINVTALNGIVTNVRNHHMNYSDSLKTLVSGLIQGTIPTRLFVKQSYTDSLGGFVMTVQMGPAELAVLNPVLHPLVSAEVKSGRLDTLSMRVVGREAHAFGEIRMLYHDLKVKLLQRGQPKKSLVGGIKNFFANTIIKNKNTGKTATIFFNRLRDRSAINYLVKITLNGIINTVIGKKNKKSFRANQEEIKSKPLPVVEEFDIYRP